VVKPNGKANDNNNGHIYGGTFLLTPSRNICRFVIQHIKDRKGGFLLALEFVDDAFGMPNKAGFEIKEFHVDNEFCCLNNIWRLLP